MVAHSFACSSVRARNSKFPFELIFCHLNVNTHVHYSLPIEGYAPIEIIRLSYICLEIVTNNTGLNEFSRYQPIDFDCLRWSVAEVRCLSRDFFYTKYASVCSHILFAEI